MQVRIEIKKITVYEDLIREYELPLEDTCNMYVGDVFFTDGKTKPDKLCDSAWETIQPFAEKLSRGEGHFYGDWMKNPLSAMISCNDGFRPVTFYLEAIDK